MSIPNEYMSPTHSFHHENVTPLVIQAAHTNANFVPPSSTNNVATHFNGGNFFANSLGYDVTMLPLFHPTSQRNAHFNASFAHQQKHPQTDVSPKEELSPLSAAAVAAANRGATSFNTDSAAAAAASGGTAPQNAYWSRQSQLSPFGVLPHEISPEHVDEKSAYENALNVHYAAHSLSNVNQISGASDGDKKAQHAVSGKVKESLAKKQQLPYVPKSANEMKMFGQDDATFRNGVINHSGGHVTTAATTTTTKHDHSKLMNSNYKKALSDTSAAAETMNTVPRDYRVLKSTDLFSNAAAAAAAAPVLKYTGKPSKQCAQKTMSAKTNQPNSPVVAPMKNSRMNCSNQPLMSQKISKYHDDRRSSPISLTTDDMNEQHRYSSPNAIKGNDGGSGGGVFHHLNAMHNGNQCQAAVSATAAVAVNYRDHHVMDMNEQNGTKNKVTAPFLKLPYAVANASENEAIAAETSQHSNRKTSFTPLYIGYNDSSSGGSAQSLFAKRVEKPMDRTETTHTLAMNNVALKMAAAQQQQQQQPHGNVNANMLMSKQQHNGVVGYSSVIMRTDRQYDNENNKTDKSARSVSWPQTESMKADRLGYKNGSGSQVSSSSTLSDQQQLLIGLAERQHSYFDMTSCTPPPPPPPQVTASGLGSGKCAAPKIVAKNVYDNGHCLDQHSAAPPHLQMASNADAHLHHYQQPYAPTKTSSSMPIGQLSALEQQQQQPELVEKATRKRRPSKNASVDYANRGDPPPAHINLYQQPIQNTAYMADGGVPNRYDMTGHHYYACGNVNNYSINAIGNAVVPDQQQQQQQQPPQQQQHQSVISSHSSPAAVAARLSPNAANAQMRQLSQMPAGFSLPAYYASIQSNSAQYLSQDYAAYAAAAAAASSSSSSSSSSSAAAADPSQMYGVPAEAASSFSANALRPDDAECSKVIVPDVEEEFKFLFDPRLRHYDEISRPAEEEAMYRDKSTRPVFFRKNIDFMASYLKFLENNCESVESLSDGSSSTMKNLNRSKAMYQPTFAKDKEDTAAPTTMPAATATATAAATQPPLQPPPPPKESLKIVTKEPECNFENDPRYYPLPKSSDKRRLCDSSSEDECVADSFEKSKSVFGAKKLPANDGEKSKVPPKNDSKMAKKLEVKKEPKKEHRESKKDVKATKIHHEKLGKAKQKTEKSQKKHRSANKPKPQMEKPSAEIKPIKPLIVQHKKKSSKDSCTVEKVPPIILPRRKVSDRKAKDEMKSKLAGVMDSDDEQHSSSDSDPLWTPQEEDEENTKRGRHSKMRLIKIKTKTSRKLNNRIFESNVNVLLDCKKMVKGRTSESTKISKTPADDASKIGRFYVLKSLANAKHPVVWKHHGDTLQQFERFEKNGKQLFASTSKTMKLSDVNFTKYQEVDVVVVETQNDKVIVEMCDEIEIPTDGKIKDNFMKESLCYENQFAVYIQTLVSQALDSNFLREIVKENDVYFLNNVKVIDDVTNTYLADLTSVVKWGSGTVDVLVKTWPFISIKNFRSDSMDRMKCGSCGKSSAKQTAIFYGQPYQRETLQGCDSNSIPSNLDKTVDICGGCAREIKLFNKIWHQKYLVFVECAKYVSKKKTDDKGKSTTDILNELLADDIWLSKLFYDIRNVWLQIWTIVQKSKGS